MPEPFGLIGRPTVAGMANLLRYLAEQTGDEAFLRAERALRQQAPGRRKIDDRLLVAEVALLVRSGEEPNLNKALHRVARTVAGKNSIRAVAERLRRKFRALETKKSSTK